MVASLSGERTPSAELIACRSLCPCLRGVPNAKFDVYMHMAATQFGGLGALKRLLSLTLLLRR
jgi:hypothetical protein